MEKGQMRVSEGTLPLGVNWGLLRTVMDMLGKVWYMLGNVWDILGNACDILGNVWDLLRECVAVVAWGRLPRGGPSSRPCPLVDGHIFARIGAD